MRSPLRRVLVGVAFAALTGTASPTLAASIDYGDFGPDVPAGTTIYESVRESSGTVPVPPARFGVPALSADGLDFDPTQFVASATGAGSALTDVQLNFDLSVREVDGAVAGGVTSLLLSEAGDFTLFGAGTALTSVAAGVSIDIDILEVDGAAISPISAFASSAVVRDLVSDGPVVLAPWSHGLLIDLAPILDAHGVSYRFGVTRAEIAIDDQLIAVGEAGSVAFIAKKEFRLDPGIVPNPGFVAEPSLGLLLLLALGGAAARRP